MKCTSKRNPAAERMKDRDEIVVISIVHGADLRNPKAACVLGKMI